MRPHLTLLALAALGVVAAAATRGTRPQGPQTFEAPLDTTSAGGVKCYRFSQYFAMEHEFTDELGADVIVRPLQPGGASAAATTCAFDSVAGDYVVRNDWAEYFSGIRRHFLFLYSGTGPQSDVVVHDVAQRRRLIDIPTTDIVGWRDSVTLEVWVRRDTLPHSRCPDIPSSLTAGVDSLMALDLRTLRYTAVGPWRCEAWQ